ncbi:hypothetical protein [Saccharopolyspora sp. ASAGF58]|uniref:hypothetical protein n=1 Tax=Saccharopolyspora sp. ASAGF58 TaxID=2719023 RepID=UPI001B3168EE|nr:hypothetical protein [Saccharopolyspora sp. ASAGF58]
MASKVSFVRRALAGARLLLGMALISWRYLWQITPLHRSEECGDESDLPPAVPDDLIDEPPTPRPAPRGPAAPPTAGVRDEQPGIDRDQLSRTVGRPAAAQADRIRLHRRPAPADRLALMARFKRLTWADLDNLTREELIPRLEAEQAYWARNSRDHGR